MRDHCPGIPCILVANKIDGFYIQPININLNLKESFIFKKKFS